LPIGREAGLKLMLENTPMFRDTFNSSAKPLAKPVRMAKAMLQYLIKKLLVAG
jgi:hypothetical protein